VVDEVAQLRVGTRFAELGGQVGVDHVVEGLLAGARVELLRPSPGDRDVPAGQVVDEVGQDGADRAHSRVVAAGPTGPAIARSDSRMSLALRAIGPSATTESSIGAADSPGAMKPASGTMPGVGLKP
jgi:hypothetical protein